MLQVFIDDSGKQDQSPVQVLAGYLASAEQWTVFSNEWQDVLDAHGIEGAFHMSDAWRLSRKFQKSGSLSRDSAVVQLTECIKRNVEFAFVSSLPFEAYNHWFLAKELKHPAIRPYFFGFYTMVTQVYSFAFRRHYNNRIEVVFDEQGGESQSYILSAMEHYRYIAEKSWGDLVIPNPTFQRDTEALPLQAADMLAWLVRRDAYNAKRKKDRSKLPEALILGEALSMPNFIKLWDDTALEMAANYTVEGYKALSGHQ